jgi:hypothetical protein
LEDKTPQNFYLGGGAAETMIGPAAAAVFLLAAILIFALPRRYVIFPFLLAIFLIPRGDVLVLGGFHLPPARLMATLGWMKVLITKSGRTPGSSGWNSIDQAVIWGGIGSACSFCLLWMQGSAIFNQVGVLWGSLGVYIVLRALIQDEEDVYRVLKVLLIVAVVNAIGMIYEQTRQQNLFGVYLGGVSISPALRDGQIRSQGAFGHAILAGTFASTLLPAAVLLFRNTKAKVMALAGGVASAVMVYTCASSTPVMAAFSGILGIGLWPIRRNMRQVRWGIVCFLVVAQIFMKAPVWFLIARMDVIGASSGYHRAELVDVFTRHFFDWWLVGTKDSGKWGWEMFDASNQYVSRGESGGLIGLWFFIAAISRSFGLLGKARRSADNRKKEWLVWCIGAMVFAHLVGFFGISYWDQTEIAWFATLAAASAAATAVFRTDSHTEQNDTVGKRRDCSGISDITPGNDWYAPEISIYAKKEI